MPILLNSVRQFDNKLIRDHPHIQITIMNDILLLGYNCHFHYSVITFDFRALDLGWLHNKISSACIANRRGGGGGGGGGGVCS